jgi:hypothetical protein
VPQASLNWAKEAFILGNEIMQELGLTAYAVLAQVQDGQKVVHGDYQAEWLNQMMANEKNLINNSRSPMVANWKFGELLVGHPLVDEDEVRCTPILTDPTMRGTGWLGGVQMGQRIIAVSALAQPHDQFLAVVMHTAGFINFTTEFTCVTMHGDTPVVVLQSVEAKLVLEIVASICKVPVESLLLEHKEGLSTKQIIFVKREEGEERQPDCIGLTIQQL